MIRSTVNANRKLSVSAIVASADPALRRRVLQQLATHDCSAQEAGGGAEALALLEEGACQALLLDQSLPDLDADELVAMIRTRHPQVEIVFLDAQLGWEAATATRVSSRL